MKTNNCNCELSKASIDLFTYLSILVSEKRKQNENLSKNIFLNNIDALCTVLVKAAPLSTQRSYLNKRIFLKQL